MGEDQNRLLWSASMIAGAVVAAAILGSFATHGPRLQPAVPAPDPAQTTSASLLVVHVAGWVENPGVFRLAPGSIVAHAIETAGGLRAGADTGSLNLAVEVSDGEQIVVPGPGESGESGEASDRGVMSLNRATSQDLEALPGVGPVLAERIVAHRRDIGRFETVEDLLDVPGIGEAKLAMLRDLVRP